MKLKTATLTLTITLLLLLPQALAVTVSVAPAKPTYLIGESLTVSGSVSPVTAGYAVSIQLFDPNGLRKAVAQITPAADGTFTATNIYTFSAQDPAGTWRVRASYQGVSSEATFTLISDTTPPTIVSITLDKSVVKGGAPITVTVEATDDVGVASVKADNIALTLVAGLWVGTITAAQTEGEHTITVVASDAAGNEATGTETYTVDNTPPTIAHTPVETATVYTAIPITATITDNIEVKSATLNYRTVGAADYTSLAMTAVGNTYTATIPATAVTAAGVEYYIKAEDTATNEAQTPTYTITAITATLTVTPEHAPPGESITYSGTNFTPNATYTLTIDWSGITVTLATGTATPEGTISGTFKVPAVQSQVYTIVAKDAAGITATAKFGVEQVSTTELATKIDALSTQLTNVEKTLSTKMDTLQTAVTKAISDAQTAITAAISSAQSDVKAAISTAQKAITDAVSSAQSDIKAAVSSAQTALSESIKSVDNSITSAQSDIKAAVSSAQKAITDAVSSTQATLSGSISAVKSSVDNLTDTVNNINTGVATASTFTLVITALVVITLVIEIVILIRRR